MDWTERKVQDVGGSGKRISLLQEFYEEGDFGHVEEAVVGDFLIVRPADYPLEEERTSEYSFDPDSPKYLDRESIQEELVSAIACGSDVLEMSEEFDVGTGPALTPSVRLDMDDNDYRIRDMGDGEFSPAQYANNMANFIHFTLRRKAPGPTDQRKPRRNWEENEQYWAYNLRQALEGPEIIRPEPEEFRMLYTANNVREALSNTYRIAREDELQELAGNIAEKFLQEIEGRDFGTELRDTLEDAIPGETKPEDIEELDQTSDSRIRELDDEINKRLAETGDREKIEEIREIGSVSEELAETPVKIARDALTVSDLEA